MGQEQIRRQPNPEARGEQEPVAPMPAETNEKAEELKAELDDLLDEIDEVLEVNADEFVKGYIQKGGQ